MTFHRDLVWKQIELENRASVAYHAARYALALDYPMLPEDVLHQAKRCLLDALGCAIGGYESPGAAMCERTVMQVGGPEEATVFGSGLRTTALNASLVNGFLVRFLDFNDVVTKRGAHGSDALASILAVSERENAGGKDLLTALVISYELGLRFNDSYAEPIGEKGWAIDIAAGFQQPPALGKLMGLDEDQIANAIGICMSHALPLGILDSDRDELVMAKNLRFAWTAHDALLACMLAQQGFTGPVRVIESDKGIRGTIARGGMDLDRLLDLSGWRILDVRFKSLAAHATGHGHMSATLGIVKEQNLRPEDIAAVRLRTPLRTSVHTVTPARKFPRNAESADHSAFYATALLIKERAFGAASIEEHKLADPVVLDLIGKTTLEADPGLTGHQGISEITTKDGRRFQKRVDTPHGFGDDPLTDSELEEKFRGMASKRMSEKQIKSIFDACWNVEKLADVGTLTQLMVFPGGATQSR